MPELVYFLFFFFSSGLTKSRLYTCPPLPCEVREEREVREEGREGGREGEKEGERKEGTKRREEDRGEKEGRRTGLHVYS